MSGVRSELPKRELRQVSLDEIYLESLGVDDLELEFDRLQKEFQKKFRHYTYALLRNDSTDLMDAPVKKYFFDTVYKNNQAARAAIDYLDLVVDTIYRKKKRVLKIEALELEFASLQEKLKERFNCTYDALSKDSKNEAHALIRKLELLDEILNDKKIEKLKRDSAEKGLLGRIKEWELLIEKNVTQRFRVVTYVISAARKVVSAVEGKCSRAVAYAMTLIREIVTTLKDGLASLVSKHRDSFSGEHLGALSEALHILPFLSYARRLVTSPWNIIRSLFDPAEKLPWVRGMAGFAGLSLAIAGIVLVAKSVAVIGAVGTVAYTAAILAPISILSSVVSFLQYRAYLQNAQREEADVQRQIWKLEADIAKVTKKKNPQVFDTLTKQLDNAKEKLVKIQISLRKYEIKVNIQKGFLAWWGLIAAGLLITLIPVVGQFAGPALVVAGAVGMVREAIVYNRLMKEAEKDAEKRTKASSAKPASADDRSEKSKAPSSTVRIQAMPPAVQKAQTPVVAPPSKSKAPAAAPVQVVVAPAGGKAKAKSHSEAPVASSPSVIRRV